MSTRFRCLTKEQQEEIISKFREGEFEEFLLAISNRSSTAFLARFYIPEDEALFRRLVEKSKRKPKKKKTVKLPERYRNMTLEELCRGAEEVDATEVIAAIEKLEEWSSYISSIPSSSTTSTSCTIVYNQYWIVSYEHDEKSTPDKHLLPGNSIFDDEIKMADAISRTLRKYVNLKDKDPLDVIQKGGISLDEHTRIRISKVEINPRKLSKPVIIDVKCPS